MRLKVCLMVLVVLSCLCLVIAPNALTQENKGYVFESTDKMSDVLFGHRRTKVTIILNSGVMVKGTVVERGEQVIHLKDGLIGNRMNENMYIYIGSISAVIDEKTRDIKVE